MESFSGPRPRPYLEPLEQRLLLDGDPVLIDAAIAEQQKQALLDGMQELATWAEGLETCSTPVTYRIYRSTDPGFSPGPGSLVSTSSSTTLIDVDPVADVIAVCIRL